ncbi:MAG: hypothetical protein D6717_07000 [Gammaproteobacteria bacterium]|nr:MAG: hypothetical protein D6717_07000 [Gammaproteobacteria bacterium]
MRTSLLVLATILSLPAAAWANIASEGHGHHVNVLSFMPEESMHGKFDYPAELKGSFGQAIESLEGKAEPFAMVHPPRMHDGDVINLQTDALGLEQDGRLEDDGINCNLTYHVANGAHTVGGICEVITATHADNVKRKVVIKPVQLPAGQPGSGARWLRIMLDDSTGVAVYANVEE